jgi:hypothetical protein
MIKYKKIKEDQVCFRIEIIHNQGKKTLIILQILVKILKKLLKKV